MKLTKEEIEVLRQRIRTCYRIKYEDDPKRLEYLDYQLTSESNPMVSVISRDLIERFRPEEDPEDTAKKYGFSESVIRDLLFSETKRNFNDETIRKIDVYCEEVERQASETESKDRFFGGNKKRAKRILIFIGIISFVTLLVSATIFVPSYWKREKPKKMYLNPDPTGKDLGFLYLSHSLTPSDSERDTIKRSQFERYQDFSLKFHIENRGAEPLINGRARLQLISDRDKPGELKLRGVFSCNNGSYATSDDVVIEKDSLKDYKLIIRELTYYNPNLQCGRKYFRKLDYKETSFEKFLTIGLYMGDIDNHYHEKGESCSDAFLTISAELRRISSK